MKKNFAILTLIAAIAFAFTMPKEMLKVDTDASYITWKGYKVTGQHHGKVKLKSGTLEYDNGKLVGGNFEINMTTITNEDLQGGGADRLVGHLKSEDFFGVEKYPTAKFVITKIAEAKAGEYRVKGDLTIKSTTKPVSFNALVSEKEGKQVATATIKIDRSEYDIRYGSGSFFENLGDKTIYDEFDLEVMLVANK